MEDSFWNAESYTSFFKNYFIFIFKIKNIPTFQIGILLESVCCAGNFKPNITYLAAFSRLHLILTVLLFFYGVHSLTSLSAFSKTIYFSALGSVLFPYISQSDLKCKNQIKEDKKLSLSLAKPPS
jgi:hypothetical protein